MPITNGITSRITTPRVLVVSGDGGGGEGYTRPADWLTLPTLTAEDERFVGLVAVFDNDNNYVALECGGDYVVDWGDGSEPENVAGDTTAEHLYDYADLTGSECSRGYRQSIISVTPQAEAALVSIDLRVTHSAVPSGYMPAPWIDIAFAGDSLAAVSTRDDGTGFSYARMLEIVTSPANAITESMNMFTECVMLQSVAMALPVATNASYMFSGCTSLQLVELALPVATNASYMFSECTSLQSVELTLPALTDASGMFGGCTSLQLVELTLPALTDASEMFAGCTSLQLVELTLPALTDASEMFAGCTSLQSVDLTTPTLATASSMFAGCYVLRSVTMDGDELTGTNEMFAFCASLASASLGAVATTISYAGCCLSTDAIVQIFTDLADLTALDPQTINVVGNPGMAALTTEQIDIAEDKNWIVTILE